MFHTFCLLHCPSLSTSKKKLGDIPNMNIWSYNFKFSEKNCFILPFYCNVLYTGCRKKRKIAYFIEHALRFRIRIAIISIPYYAPKFSVLYFLFYFVFIVLHCRMYRVSQQLSFESAPQSTSKEKLGSTTNMGVQQFIKIWVFSSLLSTTNMDVQQFVLKFSRDRFFIPSCHFTVQTPRKKLTTVSVIEHV